MTDPSHSITLASASRHRATLLRNAGVDFEQQSANIDERAVEAALDGSGTTPPDRATILAEAKAHDVSDRNPSELTIGCDQILSLGEDILHKVSSMEEARRRLLLLSGETHHLHSSVVLVRDGNTLWRHVESCAMTMRDLDPAYIGRHLAKVGDGVLASVGAYQIEGPGAQLFEKIEGDFFSIIGLPLIPLLGALRHEGAIDG
ncbi:MAG: Maf-like protein [Ahrensia sp.]|nr:Maf-like protein [Ahrensia sp.]